MRVRRIAKHIYKYHLKHKIKSDDDNNYYLAEKYLNYLGEEADKAKAWYRQRLKFWKEGKLVSTFLYNVYFGSSRKRPRTAIEKAKAWGALLIGRIKWWISRRRGK